jgi:F-box-like
MSVLTSQSNELVDDVLQMIFQQLEGEDLVNCETVCRQWRNSLLAGTPWKRLFHRNKENLPLWRKAQKKLEKNQLILRAEEYRGVCKEILQANRNWHTGNCTKLTYPVDFRSAYFITISDDYVAWDFFRFDNDGQCSRGCFFLDMESMEFKEIPVFCQCEQLIHCYYLDEMLLFWNVVDTAKLEIVNPNNRWVVDVLEGFNEGEADDMCVHVVFGSKFLVTYFCPFREGNWERMRIWKMGNPPTLLHERSFEDRKLSILKVDERFIVARQFVHLFPEITVLYFISTETLEETKSFIQTNGVYVYNQGLFFEYCDNGVIRILDAASGKYFNDVRIPFRSNDKPFIKLLDTWASSNSQCIVIGWKYSRKWTCSHLSVYDLETVKKPNSFSHLLYTLQFQFNIDSFVMNESDIAFNGVDRYNNRYVTVLKFANFSFADQKSPDLKENPEANEDIKMKVILGPYVDCDPVY